MIMEEPVVEFVEMQSPIVCVETGAGYTICQKITGTNVSCEGLEEGSNISYSEVCGIWTCDEDSNFEGNYYQV